MSETRVLIIDDEEEFASTLAERLGIRGFRARAVFSAAAGLELVAAEAPDVVLLDLKMPGVSGLETLRRIKAAAPAVEVIILTGYGGIQSELEGIESGAFDYVMKPVDISVLVAKIAAAREKRQGGPGRGGQ